MEDFNKPESVKELYDWKRVRREIAIDLLAGSAAGTACTYVGQPFDTVKVKMQTFPDIYKSSIKCSKDILKSTGLRGFFAGSTPALVAQVGENGTVFLCYGQCAKVVALISNRNVQDLNAFHLACAGSLAAFFTSIVLCPLELVKCRLQVLGEQSATLGSGRKAGPWGVISDVMKKDGPLGFYRGFVGTIVREMPGYFFFFGGYEISKYMLTPAGKDPNELELWRVILSGGIGGTSLWAAIYPADVIKSRTQINTESNIGFMKFFAKILREEGIAGLYRGITPCLLRSFPANAALFVAYEWTKKGLTSLS